MEESRRDRSAGVGACRGGSPRYGTRWKRALRGGSTALRPSGSAFPGPGFNHTLSSLPVGHSLTRFSASECWTPIILALSNANGTHSNAPLNQGGAPDAEWEATPPTQPSKLKQRSMKTTYLTSSRKPLLAILAATIATLAIADQSAVHAQGNGGFVQLDFDTALTSLSLVGGPFPMPLASDPGNLLGDSISGYGFVNAQVSITLSSQRLINPGLPSLGHAFAYNRGLADGGQGGGIILPQPIDPNALDGEQFFVSSFFDVYFDITVTDIDPRPGRNFAGQVDGASIPLLNNGPANMQSFYQVIFDKDAPNFGLIPPPQADPYIGHFDIEILLGGDINGNGENDKIKFQLASHAAGDGNRQFITLPNGTVLDMFDSAAFLAGAVVDVSTDPPFTSFRVRASVSSRCARPATTMSTWRRRRISGFRSFASPSIRPTP